MASETLSEQLMNYAVTQDVAETMRQARLIIKQLERELNAALDALKDAYFDVGGTNQWRLKHSAIIAQARRRPHE